MTTVNNQIFSVTVTSKAPKGYERKYTSVFTDKYIVKKAINDMCENYNLKIEGLEAHDGVEWRKYKKRIMTIATDLMRDGTQFWINGTDQDSESQFEIFVRDENINGPLGIVNFIEKYM